jgi:hypothetical protein
MRRSLLTLVSFIVFGLAATRFASAEPLVSVGDASISQDGVTWSVAAGGTTLTLIIGPSRDFEVVRLATPSNIAWTIGAVPDTTITVAGQALAFGSRAAGFSYISADAWADGRIRCCRSTPACSARRPAPISWPTASICCNRPPAQPTF